MKLPRFVHRLYAFLNAYSWLPCPICDKNFGGHEGSPTGLMTTWHSGKLVCPDCGEEAQRVNQEQFGI